MKATLIAAAIIAAAAVCLLLGFWMGFRQGWHLGYAVQVSPDAAVQIELGRRLQAGHVDEVDYYFESQVDGALMYWHDVLDSPVSPFVNNLTGGKFLPEYETYIRSLAQYRKTHPSPLWDPADMAEVDEYLSKQKPDRAAEFAAASREAKAAMDEVVSKYAP